MDPRTNAGCYRVLVISQKPSPFSWLDGSTRPMTISHKASIVVAALDERDALDRAQMLAMGLFRTSVDDVTVASIALKCLPGSHQRGGPS